MRVSDEELERELHDNQDCECGVNGCIDCRAMLDLRDARAALREIADAEQTGFMDRSKVARFAVRTAKQALEVKPCE